MAQDLAAEMVRRRLCASDTGYTSGFGATVSCPAGTVMAIAGVVAYPVNRWLIARGRGHAVLHGHH